MGGEEETKTDSVASTSSFLLIQQLETLPLYTGPFRLASPSPLASLKPKLDKFYQSLPKMLWELGSKDLAASEVRFPFLSHSLSHSPSFSC